MNCEVCHDHGVVKLNWSDAPPEYGICLCQFGLELRNARNVRSQVTPLWQVWAAREQVDPSLVWMLEDVLTPAELAERGFQSVVGEPSTESREAALMAAGKSKRVKL
jgi:hypothetical protein